MKVSSIIIIFIVAIFTTFELYSQKRFVKSNNESKGVTYSVCKNINETFKNCTEIIERRDKFAKHYIDSNNKSFAIISSGEPFHYNKNGVWKEIDNTIEINNTGKNVDYNYKNDKNSYETYFGQNSNKGIKYNFKEGVVNEWIDANYVFKDINGNIINKIINNENNESKLNQNELTYLSVFENIDAKFTLNGQGKKMEYLINSESFINSIPVNTHQVIFYEKIIIENDWKYTIFNNSKDDKIKSEIILYDNTGNPIIKYNQPICYDTKVSGQKRKRIFTEYDIIKEGNSLIIGIIVPIDWLKNNEFNYPIVIDPTSDCYPSNIANWTGWVNDDYSKTSGNMWVGWYDGTFDDDWEDAWAKFDVTSIPDGSGISSIDLHLFQFDFWGVDIDVDVVQLTNEPVARSGTNLFNDIEYSTVAYNTIGDSPGFEDYSSGIIDWTIPLNSSANTYMQSTSLTVNWFAIGLYCSYSYGYLYGTSGPDDSDEAGFYGYSNASYKPYIRVSYCTVPTGVNAGTDQEICTNSLANIQASTGASIGTGSTCTWSVTIGSSNIVTPSSISTAVNTIANGTNTFRLTVYDATGLCSAYDEVNVKNSTPTTANAGSDGYSCDGSYNLAGNSPVYGSGVWTVSSGAGIFANNALYNTSVSNLNAGNNTFTWTISNGTGGMCTSSDNVVINYVNVTVANAGVDQAICASNSVFAGNVPGGGESGTWSLVAGSGSITTPSSNTSAVTSIGVGNNSFRWTITHTASGCISQDIVVITSNLPTTANAGPDQTITTTTTNLAGNLPTSGTGTWSWISGPGAVTTPSLNTSGVTGVTSTTVFRWTITNALCPGNPSTDDVSIYYDPGVKGLIITGNFTNNGVFDHTNDANYFFMDGTSKLIDGTSGTNNYIDAKIRVYGTITFDGVISNGKFSKTWVAGAKTFTINNARTYKNHWFTNDGTTTLNATSIWENSNHWINNSTVTANASSTVKFNGSAAQNVTSGASVFGNVEVINTVAPSATDGVVLIDDMSINSASILTFTDGVLIANSKNIIVNNTSNSAVSYSGANSLYDQSWVYGTTTGTLRRYIANSSNGEHAFPVGKSDRGNLAILNNNSLPSAAGMYIDCYFKAGSIAGINTSFPSNLDEGGTTYSDVLGGGATEGVWVFTKNVTGIDGTYDLKLYFNGFSGSLTNKKFGILSRPSDPGNGATWEIPSSSVYIPKNVSDGYAYRTGIASFSEKGIGRTSVELPVELLYFEAICNDNNVGLNWATASEINNDYFVIEKSNDLNNWSLLDIVDGNGNSESTLFYNLNDYELFEKIQYYRLKQVDYNGDFYYSKVISSNCYSSEIDNIKLINELNYNNIIVNFNNLNGQYVNIYLMDNLGRNISNEKIYIDSDNFTYEVSKQNIGLGIYNFVFVTNNKIIPKQIVVIKN